MRRLQLFFASLFVCGAFLAAAQSPDKVIIGYVDSPNRPLIPREVAAEKLTTSTMRSPIPLHGL